MIENNIATIFQWLAAALIALFVLVLISLGVQTSNAQNFQQQVNAIIQRNGGLTHDSVSKINALQVNGNNESVLDLNHTRDLNISKNNQKAVSGLSQDDNYALVGGTSKQDYGNTVYYAVKVNYHVPFMTAFKLTTTLKPIHVPNGETWSPMFTTSMVTSAQSQVRGDGHDY